MSAHLTTLGEGDKYINIPLSRNLSYFSGKNLNFEKFFFWRWDFYIFDLGKFFFQISEIFFCKFGNKVEIIGMGIENFSTKNVRKKYKRKVPFLYIKRKQTRFFAIFGFGKCLISNI